MRIILRVFTQDHIFAVHDPAEWTIVQEEVSPGLYRPLAPSMSADQLKREATRIEVATAGAEPLTLAAYSSFSAWTKDGAPLVQVSLDVPSWMVSRLDDLATEAGNSRRELLAELLLAGLLAPAPASALAPVAHRCELYDGRVVLLRRPDSFSGNWSVILEEVGNGQYRDVTGKLSLGTLEGWREIVAGDNPHHVLARFASTAAWQETGSGSRLITPELPRWLIAAVDAHRGHIPRQHIILDWWLRYLHEHPVAVPPSGP